MRLSGFLALWLRRIAAAGALLAAKASGRALTLGNDVAAVGDLDGWSAIFVVDETTAYINTTGARETVTLDRFRMQVGAVRGRVTPFVVRVTGDNRFTVMAVRNTRVAGADFTAAGVQSFPFSEAPTRFDLVPGDRLAGGFTDAAPELRTPTPTPLWRMLRLRLPSSVIACVSGVRRVRWGRPIPLCAHRGGVCWRHLPGQQRGAPHAGSAGWRHGDSRLYLR